MNLRSLDLNLLVVFDALMTERHVSRAAAKLALSQPAVSNALARLRAMVDDPLLVRTSRGMEPTARALEMHGPIRAALAEIQHTLSAPARFDPREAKHHFVIGASDYMEFLVMPRLVKAAQQQAPGVDLSVRSLQLVSPEESLDSGEMDLAFGYFPGLSRRLRQTHLFTEHLECAVRQDHPAVKSKLTLDQYVKLPHLFVSTRRRSGVVDDALAKLGRSRRISVSVPHFLVAPYIIVESDVIMTVNSRIARTYARTMPIRVLRPPLELPDFPISMVWHPRSDQDSAHQWLRARLVEVCRELQEDEKPPRNGGSRPRS
ncbi:MAG TPA: LysR family transcriptional regulator [Burkholderiales bacterium]|nr:LysR family transcriptional regulator [Burkholderiales bacterium]